MQIGAVMGILQFRIRHVDVLHHGQRRWKASASHRHFESAGRTVRVRDVKPNAPIPQTDIR